MKLILIFLFLSIHNIHEDSPALELVKRFFNKEVSDYKSVLRDEALKYDLNPAEINAKRIEFETMQEDKYCTSVAVTLYANEDSVDNIYVFLANDNGWKIEAIRTLSLPGFYFMMLDKYRDFDTSMLRIEYQKEKQKAKITFDSLKSANKNRTDDKFYIRDTTKFEHMDYYFSEQNFLAMIFSMRLCVSNDKKLIEHFNEHQTQFDELQRRISGDTMDNNKTWFLKEDSKYSNDFYKLTIAQVYREKEDNFLRFLIGGILDNSSGYLYCDNPDDLPEISRTNFIMLKKISDKWYVYKTT